ncbi:MAG: WD40 repeat domain-containing protein [Bacteroides sp.]|nr:WD40 repeat domain-containing protein [Bacteroides sp.]
MLGKITIQRIFLCLGMAVVSASLSAQVEELRTYKAKRKITSVSNASYRVLYYNGKGIHTYNDNLLFEVEKMREFAIIPSGASLAVLDKKGRVVIYSCNEYNKVLHKIKNKRKDVKGKWEVNALCYGADARNLIVANSLSEILVYDPRDYSLKYVLQGDSPAQFVRMSPDNYFIAAVRGKEIDIWNFDARSMRKQLSVDGDVLYVAFSNDGSMMASVDDTHRITLWNTVSWEPVYTYAAETSLSLSAFNADDKYLAFVQGGDSIRVLNLRNQQILQTLPGNAGAVTCAFMKANASDEQHLLTNRHNELVYWNANGLNPFYGKLLNQEVDQQMNEWVKMMQGESLEEYQLRVNDETRARQQELFSIEAATRLAGDRIAIDNPFTREYSAATGLLAIGFEHMPDIEIPVGSSEVGDFNDPSNFFFSNAQYVLNDKDEFEIAYVEVLNEVSGKVYIYDNIGRLKLTAMEVDDHFIPLEVMQQVSQEGMKLEDLKQEVLEENKQDKLITDNTQITVNTEVVAGVDAEGNRILNYKIGYQYEVVNRAFSANEDFPSGGYDIEKSNAAMSMMRIIRQSFQEGDFAKYLSEGKRVKVKITGSADASPIRGRIAYDGRYGDFVNEPYYSDGILDNLTITKASGITQNQQLAYLRAAGVQHMIENHITTLQDTRNEYDFYVEVATERGGEYRKISVEFTILDAF